MNAPKTQEEILEKERLQCAARHKELSSIRLSTEQIDTIAEGALNAQIEVIQNEIGVLNGDLAGFFFSDGKQKSSFVAYIQAEKEEAFRDLIEPASDEQKSDSLRLLDRLVSIQVLDKEKNEPTIFVGRSSQAIEAALAHYRIEYESNEESTQVWHRREASSLKALYNISARLACENTFEPKDRVFLLEAAIMHAAAEESAATWAKLREETTENKAMIDFLLESESSLIEHYLGQHIDATNQHAADMVRCHFCLNPLQLMLNTVQETVLSDLARLESVEEATIPAVVDRNGRKYVWLEKLTFRQKVYAIQAALKSGKFTLVGEAEAQIMECTAGDKDTFLMISSGSAAKLNPMLSQPEVLTSSPPTVHLDW